jgi:hypothetical protein
MGSTKHGTTTAATTALPKWDAQTTADRLTSLRSSLQFALIDSSTSLLLNNNSSNSNSNAGVTNNNKNGGSPFSPTRASATLNAHSATMNRSATTTSTTTTAFGRSISTSGDDIGGLPKPLLGRSISYQNNTQNSTTSATAAVGGGNSSVNNANDIQEEELIIDPPTSNNTAKMKPAVAANKSAERSADNNNSALSPFNSENNNNNNFFNNGNNNSHQYHVNTIRTLLFNTPLNTPFNDKQQPNSNNNMNNNNNNNNNNDNYVYLLPRIYIRKWCNWTRCNIVIECVDEWLVNNVVVSRLLDGSGSCGGDRSIDGGDSNEDDRVRATLTQQST